MRRNFTLVINTSAGGSRIRVRSLRLEYFKKSNCKRVAP